LWNLLPIQGSQPQATRIGIEGGQCVSHDWRLTSDTVTRYVEEVWTRGNLAYIDQLMDPDFIRFGPADEGNAAGISPHARMPP
jgi:hypothetical protein